MVSPNFSNENRVLPISAAVLLVPDLDQLDSIIIKMVVVGGTLKSLSLRRSQSAALSLQRTHQKEPHSSSSHSGRTFRNQPRSSKVRPRLDGNLWSEIPRRRRMMMCYAAGVALHR